MITVDGEQIHVQEASLEVDIGSGVATKAGKPSGSLRGPVSAKGMMKIDGEELDKLLTKALAAGSWEMLEALDVMFYAFVGGKERKVEAFGCKLKAPGLSINTEEAEQPLHDIEFDVTGEDFVAINGVPLAAPRSGT